MDKTKKLYPLQGKIQHYAWGGSEFIPRLLHMDNPQHQPFAEYWMGAHPAAPSAVIDHPHPVPLDEFIARQPEALLSSRVYERFGQLPYLLKILDVREMLSIQVHPTKAAAEAGFERENAAGIPLNSPHRNYKDDNHKPEMMIALSEFWLLHGFLPEEKLSQMLARVPEFGFLQPVFEKGGYYELYRTVMEMEQQEVNDTLRSLVENAVNSFGKKKLLPDHPSYWAAKAALQDMHNRDIDRGIFSIYFFNIVKAMPGEGIFQGAGVPHAYLQGQNVELMASSDNVLRGGLTPKHVDVPELLQHINFEATVPQLIHGEKTGHQAINYPCPVDDFGISKIVIAAGASFEDVTTATDIFIVMEGKVTVSGSVQLELARGESVIAFSGEHFHIHAQEKAVLYRAYVP